MQFGLAHRALQAEQKTIVEQRRVIHAVGVAESLHGETHGYVGDYVCVLADVLVKEGRNADAVPLYRRAIEILRQGTNAPTLRVEGMTVAGE